MISYVASNLFRGQVAQAIVIIVNRPTSLAAAGPVVVLLTLVNLPTYRLIVIKIKPKPCKTPAKKVEKALNNVDKENLKALTKYVNKYGGQFGITNINELQHFLAQTAWESIDVGGTYAKYGAMVENLNYSKSTLLKKYPAYFAGSHPKLDVNKYADHPKNLAEFLYNMPGNNLGNDKPGDGWRFRGSGYLQNTGRWNFTHFTTYYNNHFPGPDVDFVSHPDLIRNNFKYGAFFSMWHWKNFEVDDAEKPGNVYQITKDVRGSHGSWKKRKKLYDKIKQYVTKCLKSV